jgi:hypothetical protein
MREAKEDQLMLPWYRGPIYEPKDSNFRPWSVTSLIAFLIGRSFGRLFRTRRKDHVVKEDRS